MNASSTVQPSNIPGHERLPAAAPGVPNGTPGESKRDMPASRKEWVNLFQKIPETAFLPQFTDKGSGNLSRSATPRLPRP